MDDDGCASSGCASVSWTACDCSCVVIVFNVCIPDIDAEFRDFFVGDERTDVAVFASVCVVGVSVDDDERVWETFPSVPGFSVRLGSVHDDLDCVVLLRLDER